jgi:hypothetical protein
VRKKNHDYTSPGIYFITINTDAQINWLGNITEGKMILSSIGEIVKAQQRLLFSKFENQLRN